MRPQDQEAALAILAAKLAGMVDRGETLPDTATSGLRAIAATMDQAARNRAATLAVLQAGQLGQTALDLIRIAIFATA